MQLHREQVSDAADVLAHGMVDDPAGRWLLPDPDEFLEVHRRVFADLIRLALAEGHVDTWGEPIEGVAVWLHRPALGAAQQPGIQSLGGTRWFPAHAVERLGRYATVIHQLRELARPDEHVYLDSVAVLPQARRQGIASRLLELGHDWADRAGLPCALETETASNVAFYARRGYSVVAELPLPGSGLTVSAMRRAEPGPAAT
jgi:GNAT superfamily N-acetyltransferase